MLISLNSPSLLKNDWEALSEPTIAGMLFQEDEEPTWEYGEVEERATQEDDEGLLKGSATGGERELPSSIF